MRAKNNTTIPDAAPAADRGLAPGYGLAYGRDAREANTRLNDSEWGSGEPELRSTPQFVNISADYGCNAACVFCSGRSPRAFSPDLFKGFFEEKLADPLAKAENVGFCGLGEFLLIPEIESFLDYMNTKLGGATKHITTSGLPLTARLCDKIIEACDTGGGEHDPYALIVSLHAFDPAMHKKLTGTDGLGHILEMIKRLCGEKKRRGLKLRLRLSFVVTTVNAGHLPDFVNEAANIGADAVECNYVNVYEPGQFGLSCYFDREKAVRAFGIAREAALKRGIDLLLPPSFGDAVVVPGKTLCADPWKYVHAEVRGTLIPCCYANNHIGDLKRESFEDVWNGNSYKGLRKAVTGGAGETHQFCMYCLKRDGKNVNDIRAHISQRKEIQRSMLEYLREHRNEYPLSQEDLEL